MTNKVYSNPVDTTSFKIFSIFDAFRNSEKLHYLESSLQVVLLFVSLYKDGLINEKSFPTDFDIPDIKTLILN